MWLKQFPTRSLYVYGMFIFTVVAMALVWYVCHSIFAYVQAIGVATSKTLSTNTTNYNSVNTFFSNVDNYILIVGLIVTVVWALQYSQKRGEPV